MPLPDDFHADRISRIVTAILAAAIVVGIAVPAGRGWDFANFYDAGHKALAGQVLDLYNPDVAIDGLISQGHLAYWGTPLSAYLLVPLAWMRPPVAMIVFKIENTAALLLGLWLLYRFHARFADASGLSRARYRMIFLMAALLFQPFWTVYRVGGQTTPTVFLAMVLAMVCFTSGRMPAAAACMVFVVTIKPAFILMFFFLAVISGWRYLRFVVLTGTVAGAASLTILGWPVHQRFLERLTIQWISPWFFNSSLTVILDNFRGIAAYDAPWFGAASAAIRGLAVLALIVALIDSRGRAWPDDARRHFRFSMAVAAGLFLMPIVWEHYLSVLFIPLVYLLAVSHRSHRAVLVILVLIFTFCATQNIVLILWLKNHLTFHGAWFLIATALFKGAPLLLFLILVSRYRTCVLEAYEIKAWK